MKIYIKTYGCQMNENDSLYMMGILEKEGHEIVGSIEVADVVIINTCAVRKKAEEKFYGKLGEALHLKKNKRDMLIGVGGCLAEKEREKLLEKGADFVFGTRSYPRISELVEKATSGEKFTYFEDHIDEIDSSTPRRLKGHHAWVTVIYGCDRFCSYCIVPYTRGREKSRPMEDVLNEVRNLALKGVREVTFLGQNVDAYGKDLGDGTSLAKLLRESLKIEGIDRLWFLTSYPSDVTDELIDVVASSDKISKNFHLPVQAGSNQILKRMRRRYTKEEYINLVNRIRNKVKDVSISTDIIVGFPGETERDFEETLDLLKTLKFERVNLALYSPREGTLAYKIYEDDVPREEKIRRFQRLLEVQKELNRELNERYRGKVVDVIVEARAKSGLMYGRDIRNKIIAFEGDESMMGKWAKVKVRKITAGPLYGKLVWLEGSKDDEDKTLWRSGAQAKSEEG